ncbi:MAG: hypothetical protein ACK5BF_13445, partial [Hyphomonadaceae bacterium]
LNVGLNQPRAARLAAMPIADSTPPAFEVLVELFEIEREEAFGIFAWQWTGICLSNRLAARDKDQNR